MPNPVDQQKSKRGNIKELLYRLVRVESQYGINYIYIMKKMKQGVIF